MWLTASANQITEKETMRECRRETSHAIFGELRPHFYFRPPRGRGLPTDTCNNSLSPSRTTAEHRGCSF